MSSLRKSLRINAQYQAFNDKFNEEELDKLIEEAKVSNEDPREVSIAELTPFFNLVFKDQYSSLKNLLNNCKLSVREVEETLIANFNREFLFVRADARSVFLEQVKKNNNSLTIADYSATEVINPFENKSFNAASGLENSLDTLNMIFSYLRYSDRVEFDEELDDDTAIKSLFQLDAISKRATVLKNTYDSMVWQGFYAQTDSSNPNDTKVIITPIDRELISIIEINKFRINQLISGGINTTIALTHRNKEARKHLEASFRTTRKPRHVESVAVKDGYVSPIVRQGFSDKHLAFDVSIQAELTLYYEFARHTLLPKTKTLTVSDVSVMYSELFEFVSKIDNLNYSKEGTLTIDSFYDYPFRMYKKQLVELLRCKTTYKDSEILSFIDLMTHEDGRTNFWNRPMILRGDDLLFPILPLTSSHVLYIVDEWMRAGGYDLDGRGPLFEEYVKKELASEMSEKGYSCMIHPVSDLYIGSKKSKEGRKKEEIDLIVEFSHCILVAEVKCIGYPIEPREWYNAYKRVEEGAAQLNRKISFIETNKSHFAQQLPGLLTKPIVKTVITNYPLFSGVTIQGVTTCDINYLTHYISDGGIDRGMITLSSKGRDTSRSTRVTYYQSEREFCDNLPKYLERPVFVESMREMMKWERNELLSGPFIIENIKVDTSALHRALGIS